MRAFEILIETKKKIETFTCRWCKKEFESEFGKFCPHCSRFQDISSDIGRKLIK